MGYLNTALSTTNVAQVVRPYDPNTMPSPVQAVPKNTINPLIIVAVCAVILFIAAVILLRRRKKH